MHGKVAALLELTAGFWLEMTGRENIYLKGYILGLNHQVTLYYLNDYYCNLNLILKRL